MRCSAGTTRARRRRRRATPAPTPAGTEAATRDRTPVGTPGTPRTAPVATGAVGAAATGAAGAATSVAGETSEASEARRGQREPILRGGRLPVNNLRTFWRVPRHHGLPRCAPEQPGCRRESAHPPLPSVTWMAVHDR